MSTQRGSLHFYLAAVILGLVAIGLGVWDVVVEKNSGDWLIQLILPALLVIVLAVWHSQAVRDRKAGEMEAEEEEGDEGDEAVTDWPER